MNQIMIIQPYYEMGEWVFDDPDRDLVQEPLVGGMPEIIDYVCKDIPDYEKGFKTLFSANFFPGASHLLTFVKPDEYGSGHWYRHEQSGMEGWLCPALLKYFEEPPAQIHIQVKARVRD